MNQFNNLSVRKKIWLCFGLVLIVFVIQGVRSVNGLNSVTQSFDLVASKIQPAAFKASSLEARIESVSSGLGFYLLTKDKYQKKVFEQNLKQVAELLKSLKNSDRFKSNTKSLTLISKVEELYKKLNAHKEKLITLSESNDTNILAIGYATENLNPVNRDLLQLTSSMLTSEEEEEFDEERLPLINAIHKLRFNWLNIMTEMRLFLAFKAPAALDNIELYRSGVDTLLDQLISFQENELLTLEQEDALTNFLALKTIFFTNLASLVELHNSEKWRQDAYIVKNEVGPLLAEMKLSIGKIVIQQKEEINAANESVSILTETLNNQTYSMIAIVVLFIILIAWILSGKITAPLHYAVKIAGSIASGNLKNEIQITTTEETGQLLQALLNMQLELHNNIESERISANENARIKTALDNVSGNIMVTDTEQNILYLNIQAQALFASLQTAIQTTAESFDSSAIIGNNLSKFTPLTLNEQDIGDQTTEIKFASNTLIITINNVINSEGEKQGYVIEWEDRTDDIAMEAEVSNVVANAMSGNLSEKISIQNKHGFLKRLGESINELLVVVNQAISDVNNTMQAVSNGRLNQQIESSYSGVFGEVKTAVNTTVTSLQSITTKISTNANKISNLSSEVASSNSKLSNRTEQQAGALEETAAAMEELTSIVKQNADNTDVASNLAGEAKEYANSGANVINNAVEAMKKIEHSSIKISDIISVIDEIAFQTNLLALNASVEAARAGEQGRGFAVVATEVRNLAGRSATAAKEIKELIQNSVNEVNNGSELVYESGKKLSQIEASVTKMVDTLGEISSASHEQTSGINEVLLAVTEMDTMTQQNASLAEEVLSSSISMTELTEIMIKDVAFFKV